MRILRILGLGVFLTMPLYARAPKPIAIVYTLTGEASLTAPDTALRPLRLFDRLAAGTVLKVGPGSRMALAFANGRRYELGERSRVTLGSKGLASRTGLVRSLAPVPPFPLVPLIAAEDRPGPRAGAVRIRAERITGLYPRRGVAVLAEEATLRFEPIEGGGKYRVEVQDRQGNILFEVETTASTVALPAGILRPGMRYDWMVRTIERAGPVAQGKADFVTLPPEIAEAREALRKAVETAEDGASLALLAEVDRGLGLLIEARDELRAAIRASPGDAALAMAFGELKRSLEEGEPGVVIEDVTPEAPGARVGLQKGDLLLFWCRAEASQGEPCLAEARFESPFDFAHIDVEEVPRGGVRVLGMRDAASIAWTLLPGSQSVEVRPVLPEHLLRLYQEGRGLSPKQPEAAVERWRSAAVQATEAGQDRLGIWFLSLAAGTLAEARQWPQADALYGETVEHARSMGDANVAAQLLRTWGKTFQRRGSWDEAEDLYRRSLELDQAAGRELSVAVSLHSLGTMAAQRSDLQRAEPLLRQALAIREKLAPRSSSLAATLINLGNMMYLRGELALAEDHLRRALSIQEELAPQSFELAGTLVNLGNLKASRTDFAGGEELYSRAKAIYQRAQPESLEMAKVLKNLGNLAVHRGDQETAEQLFRHALEIEEKLDSRGSSMAITLQSLGLQAYGRGDREKAEEYLRHVIALKEKLAPTTLASTLQNLGLMTLKWGDCKAAEDYLQRAYAIRQGLIPNSLDVALSLTSLGFHALRCGDLAKAEENYRRALAIQERLAPGGVSHARVLHDLGETLQRRGRSRSAEELLCRAADVFEAHRESVGRTEMSNESFFTDCLAARVEIGRMVEAFHTLERGRARAFLEQLAERESLFSANLPEEIARRRRELAKELESTQGALAGLDSTKDAAEAERLLNRLREIRDQQRKLTLQIRKSSPRLASLHYSEALDLAGARRALDPGTVLLAYAVGEEKSYLFVVHPPELPGPGLSVFSLATGTTALQQAVASFRNLLQNADSDSAALSSRSRELYDLLIGPAEARIAPAKRLLISANGPLHTLPFAALVRRGGYLIEWKPIHSVLSATVYAELKKERRPSADPEQSQIVAFGDPVYPRIPKDRDNAPAATLEVLTAVRRGLSLDPIPSTREEVKAIADLFPGTRTYLGDEATEERAKTVGSQARLLHFACHGLLNERFPLDSALALTIPENPGEGQENGLLQAWEIFESVRLHADLVTLSACDSALGQEMGGEGLVGLTRAFQYAGARSVLASMWSISDLSTARFMKRFYGYLREGRSKDEALRAAQVDQIREGTRSSHPFHWAAFQLFGDWR